MLHERDHSCHGVVILDLLTRKAAQDVPLDAQPNLRSSAQGANVLKRSNSLFHQFQDTIVKTLDPWLNPGHPAPRLAKRLFLIEVGFDLVEEALRRGGVREDVKTPLNVPDDLDSARDGESSRSC